MEFGIKTKRNMKKIFIRRLLLSRFLAKTLRINTIAMKNLLKNQSSEVDFKMKNCNYPPMDKIHIPNISGVKS